MCVSSLCLLSLFFIHFSVLLLFLCLPHSVHSSPRADVSSPVTMLKALFFSRCGPGFPAAASRPDCSWRRTNSPSLTVSLSLSLPLSLSRPAESRTGGSLQECTISPLPSPPSRPEVTEAWPPTTGLIVEILRLVHAQSNKVESLFTVVYNYPTAGQTLLWPSWLWVSKTEARIL